MQTLKRSLAVFVLILFATVPAWAQQPESDAASSLAESGLWQTAREYWQRELGTISDQTYHLGDIARAAIVFVVAMLVAGVARTVFRRTLGRHLEAHAAASETLLDDSLLAMVHQTKRIFVLLIAIYLALISLPVTGKLRDLLNALALIIVTAQAAIWANAALKEVIDATKKRRAEKDPATASAFGLINFFAQLAIWSTAVLLVLSGLGYPIGPLLAGLGVGGVAVAFALQHILSDIFCSIAIVLDKPFVLGDFIVVGDLMGTVENIGIKTTRIRSLGGEQIVFSNADLIGSRVRNYKKMYERRIVFAFGVVYETPLDKLKSIPQTVRSIVEASDHTRFDRAHFKDYGDFSLNYEVVYYVTVPDYNVYMDIQQEINLQLFDTFAKQDVAFAYPTQEIIMRPAA